MTTNLTWLRAQFDRCKPWLQAALDRTLGEYAIEHVWAEIEAERAQLWPAANSCTVTLVETFPTGLKMLRVWLSGGKLSECQQTEQALCEYARKIGAEHVIITGRKGWLRRLFGYRTLYTVIVKDIIQ